jgi:hypothetical protein
MVNPIPSSVSGTANSTAAIQVKSATPQYVQFNDAVVPIEVMTDLVFQDIGGQELINIARNNTVNGQSVVYQPIKYLSTLDQEYNANSILSLQRASSQYFEQFVIKLKDKIPSKTNYVYIDQATGDLIIELVNMEDTEQVQIEIATSGTIYRDED